MKKFLFAIFVSVLNLSVGKEVYAAEDSPAELVQQFNGVLPTGGLGFITGKGVPFVISLLLFAVIVLSLIFILIGAIGLITSGGNKEGTAKAKGTITYAIVGLVIGLLAILIVNIIGGLLGVSF